MDPVDSVWYWRPAVSTFLKERERQGARCAWEHESPFDGSRLALGGPRSFQIATATAVPSAVPSGMRGAKRSPSTAVAPQFSGVTPPLLSEFRPCRRGKQRRKKDYVVEDTGLTPLQSFALFLGLPRSELHKLPASSSQPGPPKDFRPGLQEDSQSGLSPSSQSERRSCSRRSASSGQRSNKDSLSHAPPDLMNVTNNKPTPKIVKTTCHARGSKSTNLKGSSGPALPSTRFSSSGGRG
ncbi:uncharacterized protein LOC113012396 [Astatotilapia calliptera]|uniref:uncharacterized protein LOC113012396 n=1 Tax=Astatotilapia calliptera TaxID=8154 RepID=UPI000E4274D4|nr:uncharacterized protein LOC113012396 [Astatotilapia calliptera]